MDSRGRVAIWADALQRLIMINTVSRAMPLYVVTEYPKSGGTWIAQVLAECLDLPFPRNVRPRWESAIMHGHMKYSPGISNVVVVFRDGRDCMVSWYYHTLFQNDKNSPGLVDRTRHSLRFSDYEDIEQNLPKFIEYVFEKDRLSISPYRFTWSQFVRSWHGRGGAEITYEKMVANGVVEIADLLQKVARTDIDRARIERAVAHYDFSNQAKRKPGEEDRNSFLRKGQPGDWRNKFNAGAAEIFQHYAGDELIRLGYEQDASWVGRVAK